MRTTGFLVIALSGAVWSGAAWAAPPLDVVRAPVSVGQFDQVAVLQSEVRTLKAEVAALKAAMRSHTHAYRTTDFGLYGVHCGNIQPGAKGECYVMLHPETREMATTPPQP